VRKRPATSGSFSRERAREAGRRSAEARARKQAGLDGQARGGASLRAERWWRYGPPTEVVGPLDHKVHELSGSESFSARERLQWEAEHSPSATARVAAAKPLLDDEPRVEPEPEVSGVPRRGVSLLDILVVAAACRMDLDALVAAAKTRRSGVESS
jgi:hypothetical protein